MKNVRKVGIIGIGPRGGYALERLISELAMQNCFSNIHLLLFESTGNFGNGAVYDLSQSPSNWINITERVLELDERKAIQTNTLNIDSFPSYHQWIQKDFSTALTNLMDTYPPRARIGKYLSQRFNSLIKSLIQSKIVSLHKEQVKEIKWCDDDTIQIITTDNTYKDCNEVLLTIGHQPTELSQQILDWDKYVTDKENVNLFKSAYPVANFLNHPNLNSNSTIGIRGFGLAMIDITRAIAEKFGRFLILDETVKLSTYQSDEDVKDLFVPFSLDGLPPVPKPLNARIDKWFEPSKDAISNFEKQIGSKTIQKKAVSPSFLTDSFAPIAAEIYLKLPNAVHHQLSQSTIQNIIKEWLEDQSIEHFLISSKDQSVEKRMTDFVGMATGRDPISLDYCIGQVWRHCQPSIYKQLSFNECRDTVFAEIIVLDESTKRYSYGPPVESIQQLIALSKAGVLNLDMVNDPEIKMTPEGWQFRHSGNSITATMMIDSVLDSPKIKAVKSAVVRNMLEDNMIKVVQDDLGVATDENGYLISKNENRKIPVALLGRLAKGTIIGVDAILECFGLRPQQWAKQAAANHMDWLNKKK